MSKVFIQLKYENVKKKMKKKMDILSREAGKTSLSQYTKCLVRVSN